MVELLLLIARGLCEILWLVWDVSFVRGAYGTNLNTCQRKLEKRTKKTFEKDIANEKLKFLNLCESEAVWRIKDIKFISNNIGVSQINKPAVYAIYLNNTQDDTFLPCYIGYSDSIELMWFDIICNIQENFRKDISQLPTDRIETKIISYLKEYKFKIKDIHFVILKNITSDENIEVETENLIKIFETDKKGWNINA